MSRFAPIIVDQMKGVIWIGKQAVPFVPSGNRGEICLNDPNGPVLRPLTFGERTRIVVWAGMNAQPRDSLCAALLEAATVKEGFADHLTQELVALFLAGAGLEAPSFVETELLVARNTGWLPVQLAEAEAAEIDRLAVHFMENDLSWNKLVLTSEPLDEIAAIRTELADTLLRRLNPTALSLSYNNNQVYPGNSKDLDSEQTKIHWQKPDTDISKPENVRKRKVQDNKPNVNLKEVSFLPSNKLDSKNSIREELNSDITEQNSFSPVSLANREQPFNSEDEAKELKRAFSPDPLSNVSTSNPVYRTVLTDSKIDPGYRPPQLSDAVSINRLTTIPDIQITLPSFSAKNSEAEKLRVTELYPVTLSSAGRNQTNFAGSELEMVLNSIDLIELIQTLAEALHEEADLRGVEP